jgi:hypothetical protein
VKPFEVYNPLAGRWFVLHWWTNSERGHLAFASTGEALKHVAAGIFKENPDAVVKAIIEIEVVAPTDRMSEIAEKHDVREKADALYYDVFGRLAEARDAGKKLPPQFVKCAKYEPHEGVDKDEWAASKHYGCNNCHNGICMVGMTKGDLYAKYHDEWVETYAKQRHVSRKGHPERMPSKAEKAVDGEKLWFAHANFGHHAGGVELHEVDLSEGDPEEEWTCRPKCLTTDTLFFFRLIDKVTGPIADDINATIKAAKAVAKEEDRQREAKRKKEHEEEVAQRVRSVIDFFARPRQA